MRSAFLLFFCSQALSIAAMAEVSREWRAVARLAVAEENTQLMTALLQAGLRVDDSIADFPDARDDEAPEWSAVTFAVFWNKPRMLEWLFENGGSVRDVSDQITVMDVALDLNATRIIRLIQKGSMPEDREDPDTLPDDAMRCLSRTLNLPETDLFLSLNGQDAPDRFIEKFGPVMRGDRPQRFPASLMEPTHSTISRDGLHTSFWFKRRISGTPGSLLDIALQRVAGQLAWDFKLSLKGRPITTETNGKVAKDPAMPVETVSGRLIQKHGWWVIENRQPALAIPRPPQPKKEMRQTTLGQLANEWKVRDNVFLIHPLLDAGLDPMQPLERLSYGDVYLLGQTRSFKVAALILEKAPQVREHREIMIPAVEAAFRGEDESMLETLARKPTGEIVGGYPVELIDDLIGDHPFISKEPFVVSWNEADPDPALMKRLQKYWPSALPFSMASEGSFKDGEGRSSAYGLRKTKQPVTLYEIRLTKDVFGCYDYSIRKTRGLLAGGGTRGRLVPSHGHWIKTLQQGWDE